MKLTKWLLAVCLCSASAAGADQNITIYNSGPSVVRICQRLATQYDNGHPTTTACEAYADVPVAPQIIIQNHEHIDHTEYYNEPGQQLPVTTPDNGLIQLTNFKTCRELRAEDKASKAATGNAKHKSCNQLQKDQMAKQTAQQFSSNQLPAVDHNQ